MNRKRALAVISWFLAAWTFWSFGSFAFGWPDFIGPVVGLAAAAVVHADPRGLVWRTGRASLSAQQELSPQA